MNMKHATNFNEIRELLSIACVSREYADLWMIEPNKELNGRTPVQAIKDGDSFIVKAMINDVAFGNSVV